MKKRFLLVITMLFSLVAFAGNGDGNRNAGDPLTPHWTTIGEWGTLQPTCFTGGNASASIKILIDGQQVIQPNYEVAAFAGDYLVSPSGVFPNSVGKYSVTLYGFSASTTYYQETKNKLHFKIYDHATGQVLPIVSATEIIYADNAIIGDASRPFPVTFFTEETVWQKLGNTDELAEGDIIIIAASTADYAMKDQDNRGFRTTIKITRANDGTMTWNAGATGANNPQQVQLYNHKDSGNNFAMFVGNGYLYTSNQENDLGEIEGTLNTVSAVDAMNDAYWTIAIAENGVATMTSQGTNTYNSVRYAVADEDLDYPRRFSAFDNNTLEGLNIYRKQPQAAPVAVPHMVVLNPGSGSCLQDTLTEPAANAGVTLPQATPCLDTYTFAGWATTEIAETNVAPTLYPAGATFRPEEDCMLYAVYAIPGQGTPGFVTSIAAGDVVYLVYEIDTLKKEFNGITGTYGAVADYTTAPSLQPLTMVAGNVAGRLAFQTAEGKYLNWTTGNQLTVADSISANTSWTITFNETSAATIVNGADSTRRLQYNASSPRFATYTSNQRLPYLYATVNPTYATNPSCEPPVVITAENPVIAGPEGIIWETSATVTMTCATEGASIFYTLDGSVPTTSSTLYTEPIVISENTTVRAIAGGEGFLPSGVVNKTFTFGVTYANIAAFKAAFAGTSNVPCKITGDVTYVFSGNKNYFVQDATGALLIYDQNSLITNTYNNGDVISGGVVGTAKLYGNSQIELTLTEALAAGVAGTAVEPTVATAEEIYANYANYDAKLVKLVDVTYTEDHTFTNSGAGRSTIVAQGDTTMTVYNTLGNLTATVAANNHADIIGFAVTYNNKAQIAPRTDEDLIPYYSITLNPVEHGTITCSQGYALAGTTINLNAVADTGYVFEAWNVTAGNAVITVTNNAFTMPADNAYVSATFVENGPTPPPTPTTYVLTLTANPADGGTVTGAGTYEEGTVVTVTATPAEGYNFVNWTKNGTVVATTASYNVTMNSDIALVANFESEPTPVTTYTITATVAPAEAGTVTGAGEYEEGATATLIATPAEGYLFVNWTENGTAVSANATYSFTVTADRALVANFEEEPIVIPTYTITATVAPAEAGTVTGAGVYDEGTTATLVATAAEGFAFVNWTENGTAVSANATYSFTVTADRALVANFEVVIPMYNITVVANPVEGGTVSGGGLYEEGSAVVLIAVAEAEYEFINWTDGDEVISTSPVCSFIAEADRTLVANFELIPATQYDIIVMPVTYGAITAPEGANAGDTVTLLVEAFPLYEIKTLFYYTTDATATTPIDLVTTSFVMPEANVFVAGTFGLIQSNLEYDVNEDGSIDVIDVMAIIQYASGLNPQPFNEERADVNGDGIINITDAMELNSIILGTRGDCEEYTANYDIINGQLVLESPVALAGYEFHLTAQPTVVDLPGFAVIGNWKNDEYVVCVFNLSGEKEAGTYAVLDMNGAEVIDIYLATQLGCNVNVDKGITAVNEYEANYSVFPVPARDNVRVAGPSITKVEVFNVMGQLVKTVNDVNADECEVEVSTLTAGSYLFRINTANGVIVKNVVVVK